MQSLEERLNNQEELQRIVEQVIFAFLVPRFHEYGMEATGEWEESLHAEGGKVMGRKYTEQLEYGRAPGKPPPIAPIIRWVEAKMGLTGKQAISMAWAVRTTIAQKGTTWYRKGGTELLESLQEPEVLDFFQREYGRFIIAQTKIHFSQIIRSTFK